MGCDAVVVGHIGVDELTRVGSSVGNNRGARQWLWRLRVVVVDGGGGEKKGGTVTMCDAGDVSTAVARFGNSQASIINQP